MLVTRINDDKPPRDQLALRLDHSQTPQFRLKYCTARSRFLAAARVLNVPKFLRLPVLGFFLREYKR